MRSGGRHILAIGLALCCLALAGPAAGDDVGNMWGFEDDEDFEVDVDIDPADPIQERWWDLDGSIGITTSWNYLEHRSAGPPPNGTDWTGLSRMRARLNLQLDVELPRNFELRVTPYGWYDFAFLINGIGRFSRQVINNYEWEVDFQDSYIQGPLLENLDVKIGRQVVNWGRSDTLRVIDVLNPLDNREPGRADIEDLRWAIGMAKVDFYHGPWTFTAIGIPEMRFDELPPPGSDFNPLAERLGPIRRPNDFEDWEAAAAVKGIFEGWDVSAHFAYFYEDVPTLRATPTGLRQGHSRLWLAGAGGNYTIGSWVLKGELAWLDGFQLTRQEEFGLVTGGGEMRLDALIGVEYYGLSEHTFAIEVANRYLPDHDGLLIGFPAFLRQNSTEYAIRWSADWFNARLSTTVLAVLFGYEVQDGAIVRLQGDYTIRDGLVLTAGMLIFAEGDLPPLSDWADNDRVFVDIKWSF